MSILQFPGKERQIDILEKQLTEISATLDKKYEELNVIHGVLNTLEYEVSLVEKRYIQQLREYARAIGTENVPVGFFEYSTDAIVYNTSRGFEISYENEDAEEETPL